MTSRRRGCGGGGEQGQEWRGKVPIASARETAQRDSSHSARFERTSQEERVSSSCSSGSYSGSSGGGGAYLMGDSLSCDCMDPMVSASILNGLMWGSDDWGRGGEGKGVSRKIRQEVRGDKVFSRTGQDSSRKVKGQGVQ